MKTINTNNLVWGLQPVMELLRSDRNIDKVWLADGLRGHSVNELLRNIKDQSIPFYWSPRAKLDSLSGGLNHQGVVAQASVYEYAEIDDLFDIAESKNEPPFFILLDKLEDPQNLGAILRTADGVGSHGVIIPKRRAVGVTSTVIKVSAGAAEHTAVVRVSNLAQTIDELKARGVWILGIDMGADCTYDQITFDGPVAVVVGSEGKGLGALVRKKCDFITSIPMYGKIESLNASVAAAIVMYQVARCRLNKI